MPSSKTFDEMFTILPREEQVIVQRLRNLIQECLPKATEKAFYDLGIPFFAHHRLICFIWPASIFWGPKRTLETQKAKGTSLGFNQGNRMSNEDGALLAEGRKQVYVMYFHSAKEINDDQIRALLYEASMIDDEFGEKKKRARK